MVVASLDAPTVACTSACLLSCKESEGERKPFVSRAPGANKLTLEDHKLECKRSSGDDSRSHLMNMSLCEEDTARMTCVNAISNTHNA